MIFLQCRIALLAVVMVAVTTATASGVSNSNQKQCPGEPQKVETLDQLQHTDIKKKFYSRETFLMEKEIEISPSLTSFGGNMNFLFYDEYFLEHPATVKITGNFGTKGCYLGDFKVESWSTIMMRSISGIHDMELHISTIEQPFQRVNLQTELDVFFAAEKSTERFVSILPAEEFINRATLTIRDQLRNQGRQQDFYYPMNINNQLGTIKRAGASIINEGSITVKKTSLSILSNFKKSDKGGEVYLDMGQLILLMDNYDQSNLKLLEGQRIVFGNKISSVFFGRNTYAIPDIVFAGSLEGCKIGDAIVFEDKVESGVYDQENETLTLKLRLPNGVLRKFSILLKLSRNLGAYVLDMPQNAGKFANGSIIIWKDPNVLEKIGHNLKIQH